MDGVLFPFPRPAPEGKPMKYVGVDLHKQSSTMAVVSAPGEKSRTRRFGHTSTAAIVEFFQSLGEFPVTVEATASYEWFVRLIEPLAQRVVLAHPAKLRIIAESTRTSDKLDARALADMLVATQVRARGRTDRRRRRKGMYHPPRRHPTLHLPA